MMRILLLGGTGFIGEYLAKKLKLRKDCQVLIAGRSDSLKNISYKSVEVLVVLTQPDNSIMEDVALFINSSQALKKVLYLSTFLLYPTSGSKSNEEVLPDPQSAYEKSKLQEELWLSKTIEKSDCKLCIARLGNVYGDVKNQGIVNRLILSAMGKNKELTIYGDSLSKTRDFIFIEDLVNLLEFLVFHNQQSKREIFNICFGIDINLGEVISQIERIMKKKVIFTKGEPVKGEKRVVCDNSKILKLSGYQFKFDLVKGLEKTCRNYLKFYSALQKDISSSGIMGYK